MDFKKLIEKKYRHIMVVLSCLILACLMLLAGLDSGKIFFLAAFFVLLIAAMALTTYRISILPIRTYRVLVGWVLSLLFAGILLFAYKYLTT